MRKLLVAAGAAASVCVLTCIPRAWCAQEHKGQITWDDLTGPESEKSLPSLPVVHNVSSSMPAFRQPGEEEVIPQPADVEPSAPEVAVSRPSQLAIPAAPASQTKSPVVQGSAAEETVSAKDIDPAKEISSVKAPAAQAPVVEASGIQAPATAATSMPAQKRSVAAKKAVAAPASAEPATPAPPRKEKTPLERAADITNENPATDRDTFVVNPNRE